MDGYGGVGMVGVATGERLAVSVEEAGALLGIGRTSAWQMIARGELPVLRIGKRTVVPVKALQKLIAEAMGEEEGR